MPPVALHHRVAGPTGAPAVVLGGALGSTTSLWDELVADLAADHRVLTFDLRGHGFSPSAVGPLEIADLAADVVALAGVVGLETFHYVGLSLGGLIGQQLGLDAADRLASLTLACTAPRIGDPQTWTERAALVRAEGMGPLRMPTESRWFTEDVEREQPDRVNQVLDDLVATDPESYAVLCEAQGRFDVRDRVGAVTARTLVITASEDPTCPPAATGPLVQDIPGARGVTIERAAHLANLCRPVEFNHAVREHLAR